MCIYSFHVAKYIDIRILTVREMKDNPQTTVQDAHEIQESLNTNSSLLHQPWQFITTASTRRTRGICLHLASRLEDVLDQRLWFPQQDVPWLEFGSPQKYFFKCFVRLKKRFRRWAAEVQAMSSLLSTLRQMSPRSVTCTGKSRLMVPPFRFTSTRSRRSASKFESVSRIAATTRNAESPDTMDFSVPSYYQCDFGIHEHREESTSMLRIRSDYIASTLGEPKWIALRTSHRMHRAATSASTSRNEVEGRKNLKCWLFHNKHFLDDRFSSNKEFLILECLILLSTVWALIAGLFYNKGWNYDRETLKNWSDARDRPIRCCSSLATKATSVTEDRLHMVRARQRP